MVYHMTTLVPSYQKIPKVNIACSYSKEGDLYFFVYNLNYDVNIDLQIYTELIIKYFPFSKILFHFRNLKYRVELMYQPCKCPYSYFSKAFKFYFRVFFPCEYP